MKIKKTELMIFKVKSNLADGINQLGDELEDIKEYKPSDSSSQPNGQGDIWMNKEYDSSSKFWGWFYEKISFKVFITFINEICDDIM